MSLSVRLIISLCATLASPAWAVEYLTMSVGEVRVLKIPPKASTVLVGDPDLLSANVLSDTALAVSSKRAGSTNIILLNEASVEAATFQVQIGAPVPGILIQRRDGVSQNVVEYWCSRTQCRLGAAARAQPLERDARTPQAAGVEPATPQASADAPSSSQ